MRHGRNRVDPGVPASVWKSAAVSWVSAVCMLALGDSVQAAVTGSQANTTVVEAPAEPVSYQGRLSDGGSPANGSYDFQFLLKDAATSGNTLGEVLKMTLPVQNGVFSAALPWKSSLFPGAARWIEVRVRPTPPAGSSGTEVDAPYATLERQRLYTAPYAFRSQSAGTVESVPVSSLPAGVPLKGVDGKLDSALLGADIARIADIATLTSNLKAVQENSAASLAELNQQIGSQISALKVEDSAQKQSIQTLEGANTARITDIATLTTSLQTLQAKWAASQEALEARLAALSQENSALKQSVQVLSAPARSGWMTASTVLNDPELTSAGFSLVSSTAAPAWVSASAAGAPSARSSSASVWTGQEWIVWGGSGAGQTQVASGARYRPDSDSWSELTQLDAPEARSGHTAVWTGSEMIVWGGFNGRSLNSGGRYTPHPQTWAPMSTTGAPTARTGHGAVWTGRSMVIFGGKNPNGLLADGGIYDPVSDSWTSLPTEGAPAPRHGATVLWTGKALLVWGGEVLYGESAENDWADGALLSFDADGKPLSWSPLPSLRGFAGRFGHAGVWDGRRLIVWGGRTRFGAALSDGAVWDSETAKWTAIPANGAPEARFEASAAWTGDEFVVFGGANSQGPLASGGAWNAASGAWRPLPNQPSTSARSRAVSALAGAQWMIFGGLSAAGVPMADPQRVEIRAPWHLYRRGALPAESLPISSP